MFIIDEPLRDYELEVGPRYLWLQITQAGVMTLGHVKLLAEPHPLQLFPVTYSYETGEYRMHVSFRELGCADCHNVWVENYSRVFRDSGALHDTLYKLVMAEDYLAWLTYLKVENKEAVASRLQAGGGLIPTDPFTTYPHTGVTDTKPRLVADGADAAASFRTERLRRPVLAQINQRRLL